MDGVIVGGESGPNARPMDPAWAKDLRDQCKRAKAPFFFKQWGGKNKKQAGRVLDGRTWDEMPADPAPRREVEPPSEIRDYGARLECDCCGRAAAQGMPGMDLLVTDGQPLACGCRGHISVDAESEPYTWSDDCDCDGAQCLAPLHGDPRPCGLQRGHDGDHEP